MSNKNNEIEKPKTTKIIRCIECRTETPEDKLPANLSACPVCFSKAIPEYVDQDVDIRINWHELRLLCMWAKNWEILGQQEKNERSIIDAITNQLHKYRPIDGVVLTPLDGKLTMAILEGEVMH